MLRRYQRGSEMCEKLAKALDHLTNSEDRELFDFGKRAGEASPLVRTTNRVESAISNLKQLVLKQNRKKNHQPKGSVPQKRSENGDYS